LVTGATVVTAVQPSAGDQDPASWWPVAAEVGARFQGLAVLLLPGTAASPPPLPAALGGLSELHQAVARWASGRSGAGPATPAGAARAGEAEIRRAADRVKALAAPLPAPVAGWFTGLADAATRAAAERPGGAP
jgi:type VI protein secretion system component VasK